MPESSEPSNAAARRTPALAILQDQVIGPDGMIITSGDAAVSVADRAVPLHGLNAALTGEWLLEILSKSAWVTAHPGYRLCGAPLSPPQRHLMQQLGRLEDYIALKGPTRFRAIADLPAGQRPEPSIREAAQRLRKAVPMGDARIAILPQHATEVFALANRASLAAWLRAKRFLPIDPDGMSFNDLAGTLITAGTVMMADPRQSGLLALCQPGTRIIDIAPSGWRSHNCQYLCDLFDLAWSPCEAGPPTYKLLTPLPFGARVPLSYEVPIGDLAKILQTL